MLNNFINSINLLYKILLNYIVNFLIYWNYFLFRLLTLNVYYYQFDNSQNFFTFK